MNKTTEYTLGSFAKTFSISVDELKALNTGSKSLEGLKNDDVLDAETIKTLIAAVKSKAPRKKLSLSLKGSEVAKPAGATKITVKRKIRTAEKPKEVVLEPVPKVEEEVKEPVAKAVEKPKKKIAKPKPVVERRVLKKYQEKFDDYEKQKNKKYTKRQEQTKLTEHKFEKPTKPVVRDVSIPESITVMELAKRCAVTISELMQILIKNAGMMVTRTTILDQETAEFVVSELGHNFIHESDKEEVLDIQAENVEYLGEKKPRAPVVTFMGHVDHGKTTLLDYIRRTRVTEGEAGGITQHIGAYSATAPSGGKITFLDTPGHAAFTQMRARGVGCTDIVVLVVAADDGVMPQTLEAIEHAKAANVPVVVAVNKIDKHDGDLNRIKTELSGRGIVCESWGGDAIFQGVSGKFGTNMNDLLDSILLQAEVLDLSAYSEGRAKGVVIEASLSKGRGPIASILVQSGCLKVGDSILIGNEFGRVRAMLDDNGASCKEAGPSTPVEILGLSGVPTAGDSFVVMENEKKAKEVALIRQRDQRNKKLSSTAVPTLQDFLDKAKQGELKNLAVVLKADTQGSVEAAGKALQELSNDEVKVSLISGQVGAITESDVNLAIASGAIVIGFNVRADSAVKKSGLLESVDVSYFSIIYDMIDSVLSLVKGMQAPKYQDRVTGYLLVKDVFRSSKFGLVAGCMVLEGHVKKGSGLKVLRDDIVLHEGEVISLRRYRDEVNEVKSGMECGIAIKDFNDLRANDKFEIFEKELIADK